MCLVRKRICSHETALTSIDVISTETMEGDSFKVEAVCGFGGVTKKRGRNSKIVRKEPFQ